MYHNIGRKIKTLASVLAWIGIIGSIITGLILCTIIGFWGLLVAAAGSLVSWLSSFFMYGFGQLIENTDELVASKHNPALNSKECNDMNQYQNSSISLQSNHENVYKSSPTFPSRDPQTSTDSDIERITLNSPAFKDYYCAKGKCQRCKKHSDSLVLCSYVSEGLNSEQKYICSSCMMVVGGSPLRK